MGRTVDLVADLGEGFGAYSLGDDSALLEIVSSANIACGFHAGDPDIMDRTVAECVRRGVSIGAHPSFPDLRGFGRRAMDLTAAEVRNDVLYQLGALSAFAAYHGTSVAHIAPHGRLGNLVATRQDYATAVADAASRFRADLIVLAQDGELAQAATDRGLPVAIVGIADRAYEDDGTLVPRSQPGAVIHDPATIVDRTIRMVCEGIIESASGVKLSVVADTVLLHGDNPGAVDLARIIRKELTAAGVTIAPLPQVLAAKTEAA
ncbi:5-oxoprolinase subunit PxpA [Pseudarthrobacter sp. MDT3-26]|uniref:LamB/YcsF family protein n=1 Tax=Pseudarthrobacter raffinosi TaxID=2953651 RepID=UPI00208F5122|nr:MULTISPECIES: 5-oxoprolinase subunit PxpA [unclassified Pseudarthrobacter]MCO4239180.1 5-oxoprolinase subunit PxpA [Pseudarthrobacter sp. MDT3-28]MCO4263972.1 5-oxoprolinase subunit PxpA [Pseudarthrobacter sp. MDT3-26]